MNNRCGYGRTIGAILALMTALAPAFAHADEAAPIPVTIQDHHYAPAEIHVPANQAAQLQVENRDSTAEEFDSPALGVEKVIPGQRKATVRLHPLAPGRYSFMGEYHPDTAQGVVVAE